MSKTTNNKKCRSIPGSKEPGFVKKEIGYALPEGGIDAVFVARRLRDLSKAQGRRWNRKKRCWEKCDDHRIQLAAIKEVFKILDIYPKKGKDLEDETLKIEISAIPSPRVPVLDPRSDDGERSER